ncbi:hypothetical protein AB1Y20_016298 [Prymnesium parvum]|uniref:Protein xylosyltransferase n=1 Tax=Prymnesium parvum TaxID=97485 RepID=A0AB34ICX6_PRYPA
MESLAAAAAAASAEATAPLLALLDAPALRARLHRCCPRQANWTAPQLLRALLEHLEAAELIHTFDGSFDTTASVEIALYNATEYFPHQWQLRYLGWSEPLSTYYRPNPEAVNEEGIFRLPAFPDEHDVPNSFQTASGRLLYCTLNMMRIDTGNRAVGYGNVTAVLAPAYWADAVAATPADSGFYGLCCNASLRRLFNYSHYHFCSLALTGHPSTWDPAPYCNSTPYLTVPGVRRHMNHVLLGNDRAFGAVSGDSTIARMFERWYGEDAAATNVTHGEVFRYIESNVLANVRYHDRGIKLLVGSFPALFGTPRGQLLQRWAARDGIALSWALGDGRVSEANIIRDSGWSFNFSYAGDVRILDAPSLDAPSPRRLNLTVGTAAAAAFRKAWRAVGAARDASGGVDAATLRAAWEELRGALPEVMVVGLPTPRACDWSVCVGLSASGTCVCYE